MLPTDLVITTNAIATVAVLGAAAVLAFLGTRHVMNMFFPVHLFQTRVQYPLDQKEQYPRIVSANPSIAKMLRSRSQQ